MIKHTDTIFKLSHPKMQWDIADTFDTKEDAEKEILKIQVRQKERGYTPDRLIIVRVETEKVFDDNGDFIKSVVIETRV